jgi:hypothetical protein
MAKNIIKINRGDSYEFDVYLPDIKAIEAENTEVTDIVYFALLYPHQHFEDAFLTYGYDHTDFIIEEDKTKKILVKLAPKDTRKLAPGVYYYTVKLYKTILDKFTGQETEEVYTVIERTKFIINE